MSTTNKPRLLRVTTSPGDQKNLLAGQLGFLKKKKYKVMAVSADGPEVLSLTVEGIPHKALPMTEKFSLTRDFSCFIQLLMIISEFKPTIVHTHSTKAGFIGMLAAWVFRVPVRMHTISASLHPELTYKDAKFWVNKILYACATHLYPNSISIRKQLGAKVTHSEKIRMVGHGSSNGVDTAFFHRRAELEEVASVIRRKYGIGKDSIVFSYVGKLVYEKGIRELVESFIYCREKIHSSRKMYLLIVGPIDEQDPIDPDLLQFLTDDPHVILCGYQADVRPWLMASDIFVFPSYFEGFPNIVMQASCLELPCIVSDIGGCNEIVSHNETGLLVKSGDPEALGEAMIHLAENESIRTVFGRKGREKVSLNFDQRLVWNELNKEYENLLEMHESAKLERERLKAGRPPVYQRIIKPSLDILIAFIALVVTSPLFLVCTIGLAFANKGKVFFTQRRPGKNGRPFQLLKFRTMTDLRDEEGNLLPDDKRLTSFGKFIRKTSLDELPQLVNVLVGQMSLIGPRPLLEEYMPLYSEEQRKRHTVKPGITGWAQVNGRNAVSWDERFEHDLYYIKNESLRLDLKILWMTIFKVFKAEGVSGKTSVTMEKFMGNMRSQNAVDPKETPPPPPEWKITNLHNTNVESKG